MNSHKTAIQRRKPSRPLLVALELEAIKGRVLDYGCGRGKDCDYLQSLGVKVIGYDPHFHPVKPKGKFNTVLMTYVVNVLSLEERDQAIIDAWGYVKRGGRLIITSRTISEVRYFAKQGNWKKGPGSFGYITGSGTYQHGYNKTVLSNIVRKQLANIKNIQHGPSNAGGSMIIVLKN